MERGGQPAQERAAHRGGRDGRRVGPAVLARAGAPSRRRGCASTSSGRRSPASTTPTATATWSAPVRPSRTSSRSPMAIEKKEPGAGRPPQRLPAVPPVRPLVPRPPAAPPAAVPPPAARPPAVRRSPAHRPPAHRPPAHGRRSAARPSAARRDPGASGVAGRLSERLFRFLASVPALPLRPLLLWPTLLTLAVTLLRFVGELQGWVARASSAAFPAAGCRRSASPGWLPSWASTSAGACSAWASALPRRRSPSACPRPPSSLARSWPSWRDASSTPPGRPTSRCGRWRALAVAGVVFAAWPALGRILLVYACAARLPVVLVMAVAIWRGPAGTHYDLPPPGFPGMLAFGRWCGPVALLPQSTIWVAWTMATGALGGALGWLAASRRPR